MRNWWRQLAFGNIVLAEGLGAVGLVRYGSDALQCALQAADKQANQGTMAPECAALKAAICECAAPGTTRQWQTVAHGSGRRSHTRRCGRSHRPIPFGNLIPMEWGSLHAVSVCGRNFAAHELALGGAGRAAPLPPPAGLCVCGSAVGPTSLPHCCICVGPRSVCSRRLCVFASGRVAYE